MDIFTEYIGLTHEHCTSHYILLFPHSYSLVNGQKYPFLLLPYNKTHKLAVTHSGSLWPSWSNSHQTTSQFNTYLVQRQQYNFICPFMKT